ncbi:MAG: Veg family protein [Clostridia bacterium]|nr:Veg family protein [Clostridia bacterium]
MIFKNEIANLKQDFEGYVGKKIIVKGNTTKTKGFQKEGVIDKIYSNIFVIRETDNDRNITYSYTDVLTKSIEVKIQNGEEFNEIIVDDALSIKER